MLALSAQLHKWWGMTYFAFKCRGISPLSEDDLEWEIRLQFFWMPQSNPATKGKGKAKATKQFDEPIPLSDEVLVKKLVQDWEKAIQAAEPRQGKAGGIVMGADAHSGRPLHSGRVFNIRLTTDRTPTDNRSQPTTARQKAENMKVMIDLQWASIQIATMSGAAGDPEFLGEDDDSDDDGMGSYFPITIR